jgi:hypothetical protein
MRSRDANVAKNGDAARRNACAAASTGYAVLGPNPMRASLIIASISVLACSAADLQLPSTALERNATVTAVFRTNPQATGKGTLAIRWTDVLGRVVEDRSIPIELTDETEIRFPLDIRRAAAMLNDITARFTLDGVRKDGKPDHRDETVSASFVAKPPDRAWQDYAIIMWQNHNAEQFATLKMLGVNGGQYTGRSKTPPEFLLKNDLRWYVENIATDFYSEYHRYRPDRIQHWSYLQAKELFKKDMTSKEAFKRHPSLSDRAWLSKIHDRLVDAARFASPYRPFFYDLGDESGIADLAAFWDFDFSDHSLDAMREWLKERYGTLAALNRQWGREFTRWEEAVPDTTREAMQRPGENFSSWSDHKEWMDIAFARAIEMGVDAVRSVDPDAYVAIAGGQMPGWGGYDYARLSRVLTAIEPYDIGNNIEILRSLNPSLPFVTTAFARGNWEKHRIWYEALHGARGNIIWDEKFEMAPPAGGVGDRGREVAAYYNELRGGVGALLINSVRQSDPIAIHYSQPSMRVEWMLAQRPKGDAWVDRTSATERRDSDFLRVRESYCKLIEDLGLQYRFMSYGQVEAGELLKGGYRVLILPRSSALSAAEAREIRIFVESGGRVIADGEPGAFDDHALRLPESSLAGVRIERVNAIAYLQDRLVKREGPAREAMRKLLDEAGVHPAFEVRDETNARAFGVETHTFRHGPATIIGLLGNPQQRVDELGPPEFKSNQRFETARNLRIIAPAEMYAYDVRAGKALGRVKEVPIALGPYEPALIAFSPEPVTPIRITGPARIERGSTANIGLDRAAVVHVDIVSPTGAIVPHYSGNGVGKASFSIPFAMNDAPGKWTIRVKDTLSGATQTATIEVH